MKKHCVWYEAITPWHKYENSPYSPLSILLGADKENWFHNQEFLYLVIISSILITLRCDPGVILWGEISC